MTPEQLHRSVLVACRDTWLGEPQTLRVATDFGPFLVSFRAENDVVSEIETVAPALLIAFASGAVCALLLCAISRLVRS